MRYLPLDNSMFIINRKKFSEKMIKGSASIFFSNDEQPRNGDQQKLQGDVVYYQNKREYKDMGRS